MISTPSSQGLSCGHPSNKPKTLGVDLSSQQDGAPAPPPDLKPDRRPIPNRPSGSNSVIPSTSANKGSGGADFIADLIDDFLTQAKARPPAATILTRTHRRFPAGTLLAWRPDRRAFVTQDGEWFFLLSFIRRFLGTIFQPIAPDLQEVHCSACGFRLYRLHERGPKHCPKCKRRRPMWTR